MCCSLYSPESANVDILTAEKMGIVVTGIRDYGTKGFANMLSASWFAYCKAEERYMWKDEPMELNRSEGWSHRHGDRGLIGFRGTSLFWCRCFLLQPYPQTRVREKLTMPYYPLNDLLSQVDIVITALNKNVVLLEEEQFKKIGSGKI